MELTGTVYSLVPRPPPSSVCITCTDEIKCGWRKKARMNFMCDLCRDYVMSYLQFLYAMYLHIRCDVVAAWITCKIRPVFSLRFSSPTFNSLYTQCARRREEVWERG